MPTATAVEVDRAVPAEAGAVGLPAVAGPDGPELLVWPGPDRPGAGGGDRPAPDPAWLKREGFTAKAGQALVLRVPSDGPSVVLVGLGPRDGLDAERWRRAAAALVRAAGEGGTAALVLPDDPPGGGPGAAGGVEIAAAVAEGAALAGYRFDGWRSEPKPPPVDRVVLVGGAGRGAGGGSRGAGGADRDGGGAEALAAGARRGARTAQAVAFARDLINTPPSDLTPRRLADRVAAELGAQPGTTVEVWDQDRIAAERLGGLLGVNRGSAEPPRFVRATYDPVAAGNAAPGPGDRPAPHVVLVGKGITFDSGGLSLKTADGMTTMKTDMSGAAIVLGALSACADLGVRVKVTALAPITENMPGGAAVKPGDVLRIRNGKTVEVLNTDAEGRLVLADALSLAAEVDPAPDAVVDVATLTGAAVVALGTGMGALFGTDQDLVDEVRQAGDRTGERLWPMPLPDDYADHIDSDVADMKNIGRPGQAGAIAAALLLRRFVGDLPWAHLDIAGPGRSAESTGYLSKGGTAFGLRALLALLDAYGSRAGRDDAQPAGS
ncbi:MAG TPA: leucyl aminopeptidase [Acidimicrobiales bacterium]|nr:leucyl aminopeptidase [Acidimicrobiales bacterium]